MHWLKSRLLPSIPDRRVDGFPLMSSWWPTAFISAAYVVAVWTWIKLSSAQPKGKTVNSCSHVSHALLKILMIAYNACMVMYAAFVALEIFIIAFRANLSLGCVPLDMSTSSLQQRLIRAGYLFFISKFVEMLDTVFFLSRGKLDQVSFLHVFHHAAMPPSIWWGIKYAPGGIVFVFPLVNSLVHVVMYFYYGMAAAGLYRYLWWKRYLTVLQILQFLFFIIHQSQVFLWNRDCDFPKVFPAAICLYALIFLVLFGNFYVKTYWRQQRSSKSYTPLINEEIEISSNGCKRLAQVSSPYADGESLINKLKKQL